MPDLTEKQQVFVDCFVLEGCTQTEAARRAGYADPRQRAWTLLQIPAVVDAIRDKQRRTFQTEGVSMAWRTLKSVMNDKEAPASSRVQAAKVALEAGGMLGKGVADGDRPGAGEKSLSEMTILELERFIAGGMERLSQQQGGPAAQSEGAAVH